jgi:cytochrome c-type biogenesis protein CcmE
VTRKRRRLIFLVAALLCLGGATALILTAFEDSIAYFQSPSELVKTPPGAERAIRMGGLVEDGSVVREGETLRFRVTDKANAVPVVYQGAVPDLFREGQGVVVEGHLRADGTFMAETLLAKHDERYMPKEAVDALKASGEWRPEAGGQ